MKFTALSSRRSGRRLLALLFMFLILFAGPGAVLPAAAAPAPLPPVQGEHGDGQFTAGPCNFNQTTSSLREGADFTCGTLTVPEEHAKPGGATIQLSVAILKSKSANRAPDPIVMLQGGPGGSTIDTYLQLISLDPRLRGINRDIILFDQRGTLYTRPSLLCPEYFDLSLKLLNVDIPRDQANEQSQQAIKSCHDRLVKEGVNLSAFDSLENAADVEALRLAMGYPKINLYGVSYGTLLALHVMRHYPDGLRSVIIDSVVPPQTNFIVDAPQSENRALNEVFNGCASQPSCNAAYPDLRNVFYSQVDRLNKNKVEVKVSDPKTNKTYPALLDGDSLISVVVQMLYITDLLPLIPRVIYDVRSGDYNFVERILSLVVFDRTMSLGMYYSVLCAEDADFTPNQASLQGLPKQLYDLEKDSAQQFLQVCSNWKVQPLDPSVDQPVSGSIPTLVLSGQFDPVTPPTYAQQAASTLSNSYFFLFPTGGHGEVTSLACADTIFLKFVDAPDQKPDGSCIGQLKMVFSTPGSLVGLPVLGKLLNPQGITALQAGLYVLALFFLLTALLVYPVAWLVRLFRRPASTQAVVPPGTQPVTAGLYPEVPPPPGAQSFPRQDSAARPRGLYRFAPWLASLAGILLLVFIVVVFTVALRLALANDSRVLFGLPADTRPLFILPIIAALLAVLMLIAALTAWARRSGSALGRVYFSLLTIATIVDVVILGVWGMLTALI